MSKTTVTMPKIFFARLTDNTDMYIRCFETCENNENFVLKESYCQNFFKKTSKVGSIYCFQSINSDNLQIITKSGTKYLEGNQDTKFTINLILNYKQKIIFGPPGTGKSYSVDAIAKNELCIKEPACRIQTVFHPEYTYGDFIAKLMPISKGGTVEYCVVAGHFIGRCQPDLNQFFNN